MWQLWQLNYHSRQKKPSEKKEVAADFYFFPTCRTSQNHINRSLEQAYLCIMKVSHGFLNPLVVYITIHSQDITWTTLLRSQWRQSAAPSCFPRYLMTHKKWHESQKSVPACQRSHIAEVVSLTEVTTVLTLNLISLTWCRVSLSLPGLSTSCSALQSAYSSQYRADQLHNQQTVLVSIC